MNKFYDDGLRFECTQCGHCCTDEPGYVFLTGNEISAISSHLSISRAQFLSEYCRKVPMGSFGLVSLIEKKNNDCIFFNDNKQCDIYKVRPLQCRSYPFWQQLVETSGTWKDESQQCPGIGKGRVHAKEEIEEWLRLRRTNAPKMTG